MAEKINIFNQIQSDAAGRARGIEWYIGKIKELKNRGLVTKNRLQQYDDMMTNSIEIGSMIMYQYDPKYKKTLPVYDAFPLCLPFSISPDGSSFTCFNLHYIAPRVRWEILKDLAKINQYSITNKLPPDKKMQLSWEYLKHQASAKILEPSIHKYLYSHVVRGPSSLFLKVNANHWHHAILLPVEDFRKNSSNNRKGYSSVRSPDAWTGNY